MKFEEYQTEVNRLSSVFGKNAYPPERVKILYYTIEKVDLSSFERQVTQWIKDSKAAPIGEQFREFLIKWQKGEASARHDHEISKQQPDCIDCWDTGWLSLEMFSALKQFSEAYEYPEKCSAICVCLKGQRVKAFCDGSNDYKDVARSQYNQRMHGQWYQVTNRWTRNTYEGKSLEQWMSDRKGLIKSMPDAENYRRPYAENDKEEMPF